MTASHFGRPLKDWPAGWWLQGARTEKKKTTKAKADRQANEKISGQSFGQVAWRLQLDRDRPASAVVSLTVRLAAGRGAEVSSRHHSVLPHVERLDRVAAGARAARGAAAGQNVLGGDVRTVGAARCDAVA